ncbi:hypothetical protein ACIOJE_30245 [Kitasatospora sp. NPDC087861]|nr:hypothetical protein [Kitasatospora sp. MAA19]
MGWSHARHFRMNSRLTPTVTSAPTVTPVPRAALRAALPPIEPVHREQF